VAIPNSGCQDDRLDGGRGTQNTAATTCFLIIVIVIVIVIVVIVIIVVDVVVIVIVIVIIIIIIMMIMIMIMIMMIIVEPDIHGGQDGYSSLWLYLFETCPLSNPCRCRSILDVLLRTFL
jgi:hypothetical protein